MSVADATRFDMLKKPTMAEMSQMSRSVNPTRRSRSRSPSSTLQGEAVSLTVKSSIARVLPDGGAMGGEAVVAAVLRRYRYRNNLALELRETGLTEHQVVVHGNE